MLTHQVRYIPAGCIGISREESEIEEEHWTSLKNEAWRELAWPDNESSTAADHSSGEEPVNHHIQVTLLKASKLAPLARLFRARWAKLEFRINAKDGQSGQLGVVRVHLLPDDVERRSVDRSDPGLRKIRNHILGSLDYSHSTWTGQRNPKETGLPVLAREVVDEPGDKSLLQLFNTIPSPDPDPSFVMEEYAQKAMFNLLDSQVPGLETELYDYQRRSAAMMVQKESQPGQVLDPRLLHLKDSQGSAWYMDPVAGTVLLEPRYYDAVSGGVLAEEMGSGKTIICLALILATIHLPTHPPDLYKTIEPPVRLKMTSLTDMAASCATRNAVPWKSVFEAWKSQHGFEFSNCVDALLRNPGYYMLPAPEPRRGCRAGRNQVVHEQPPKKIYLSTATVIIVPNNLVAQWKEEIQKHTKDLAVLILVKHSPIGLTQELLNYDIILFSQSRFELAVKQFGGVGATSLSSIHFKRCIVDEGHKLGNSRMGHKSNLLLGLEAMHFSSRWIVTGTPSHGLFGVDASKPNSTLPNGEDVNPTRDSEKGVNETSAAIERKDLERIGAMAALYLKARPWANTADDGGDTLADWSTYLMLPKHHTKSKGRWDCLESTLNSLIIRHRLAEVGDRLPSVKETVVILDGSYQDQLSLNLFSMMIVFNSVQSQRTDMDYFFHPRQRRSLLQIVHNLKQASFFGGSFFTAEEIIKSVQTAEQFLKEKKVPISPEDESLLQEAIRFGHLVIDNKLRNLGNQFHEMAVWVAGFPGNAGQSWSLDDGAAEDAICTSTSMLLSLQRLVYTAAGHAEGVNSLLNGGLIQEGLIERGKMLAAATPENSSAPRGKKSETLAGNTKLGADSPKKSRSHGVNGVKLKKTLAAESFSGPLEHTRITATVSAKLSYLVDSLVKYQEDEKIIVFYENENVAWYLASMLDVLQIQHLIYAKGLTTERRAQYVNTFHHNPIFRVLLMDLSQAAFGLDMREASRIYFINPVLNPQVEAQAIGRVRRISQQKPVSVETLVLRNSIDEVILERKEHMTQAEHRQVKSILDIRPIYNWIKNTKVTRMNEGQDSMLSQMVELKSTQPVFGRGFGRTLHPDDGILLNEDHATHKPQRQLGSPSPAGKLKRPHDRGPGGTQDPAGGKNSGGALEIVSRPARRVRFTADSDDE